MDLSKEEIRQELYDHIVSPLRRAIKQVKCPNDVSHKLTRTSRVCRCETCNISIEANLDSDYTFPGKNQPIKILLLYINCFAERKSVRYSAEKCGVNKNTISTWNKYCFEKLSFAYESDEDKSSEEESDEKVPDEHTSEINLVCSNNVNIKDGFQFKTTDQSKITIREKFIVKTILEYMGVDLSKNLSAYWESVLPIAFTKSKPFQNEELEFSNHSYGVVLRMVYVYLGMSSCNHYDYLKQADFYKRAKKETTKCAINMVDCLIHLCSGKNCNTDTSWLMEIKDNTLLALMFMRLVLDFQNDEQCVANRLLFDLHHITFNCYMIIFCVMAEERGRCFSYADILELVSYSIRKDRMVLDTIYNETYPILSKNGVVNNSELLMYILNNFNIDSITKIGSRGANNAYINALVENCNINLPINYKHSLAFWEHWVDMLLFSESLGSLTGLNGTKSDTTGIYLPLLTRAMSKGQSVHHDIIPLVLSLVISEQLIIIKNNHHYTEEKLNEMANLFESEYLDVSLAINNMEPGKYLISDFNFSEKEQIIGLYITQALWSARPNPQKKKFDYDTIFEDFLSTYYHFYSELSDINIDFDDES